TFWHSSTMFNFKRANRWFPIIEKVLKEEGIPDDFKYLAMIESGFDNVVSPAGASGYWQFLKMTAIKYGLEVNDFVDERYHVEKATYAAAAYLEEANTYFKNWTLTAASYNMGIGGVQQRLKEQRVKSYYDLMLVPETYRYVFRMLAAKEIYENPRFYGFNVRFKDMYIPFDTESVTVDSTINDLAKYALNKGINYKILKILNPWLRADKLPVKNGKKYIILFPAKNFPLTTIEP
ncbi:MAG: lytic transglycosylase domain-containing protein, partial [Flavobacteriales bacterium]